MTQAAEKTVLHTGKVLTTDMLEASARPVAIVQDDDQDIVPFGTQAALTALGRAHNVRILHCRLALGLRQATHLRPHGARAHKCAELVDALAPEIPPIDEDRGLDVDVRTAADVLDRFVTGHASA